jgi:hypothetical protein
MGEALAAEDILTLSFIPLIEIGKMILEEGIEENVG